MGGSILMNESDEKFAMLNRDKFNFEESKDHYARINAVLKSMSEGIILIDHNKNIVYQNEFIHANLFNKMGTESLKTEEDFIAFLQRISVSENKKVEQVSEIK